MEPDEARLLAGIAAGQPDWERIYRAYRAVMWRAARSVLDTDRRSSLGVSVEDVVQSVMEELMAKPAGEALPTDVKNLLGLLWRVTRWAALDAIAKEARARQSRLPEPGDKDELSVEDMEEIIEAAVLCAQVDDLMGLLDDDERIAFVERVKRGRPLQEVGIALGGKSDSWAARVTARALRKLTSAAGLSPPPRRTGPKVYK